MKVVVFYYDKMSMLTNAGHPYTLKMDIACTSEKCIKHSGVFFLKSSRRATPLGV